MHVYNRFRQVKTIVPEAFASTTASVANSFGTTGAAAVTINCTVGDMYINPTTTVTQANGIKLVTGDVLDLIVPNTLSTLSTALTASYQAIIWKD